MKRPIEEFRIFGLSRLRSAAHPVLCVAFTCMAMALLPTLPARGQANRQDDPFYMGQSSRLSSAAQHRFPYDNPAAYDDSFINSLRYRQFKVVRAKSLFEDTDKLLKLATELNAEVAGPKGGTFGKTEIRKVSKIAKLAHNIEQNMKMVIFPRRRIPSIYPDPFPSRR